MDRCPKKAHAKHVLMLSCNVNCSHVDDGLYSQARSGCCHRNPMLPGTRLCDKACLAELFCDERLSQCIVYLVRTAMKKILSLEIGLAADPSAQIRAERERSRSSRISLKEISKLSVEGLVFSKARKRLAKLFNSRNERFRDKNPSEIAEFSKIPHDTASKKALNRELAD